MKKLLRSLLVIALFFSPFAVGAVEWAPQNLPPILEEVPKEPFQVLSPVGAGKKTIDEARVQMQREAVKVDADAIINTSCKPGGLRRSGLSWEYEDAYCKGTAIHLQNSKPKN